MPSADIGEVVPQLVEAATYDWKWYYSASGSGIWLALILAFVVPRANRNIQALLILAPLAIVNILWWCFIKFANMNSVDQQEFSFIFHSMAVSVTVLWLIANYSVSFGGAIRFLLSFVTVMIVAGLGILSRFSEFTDETTMFSALFALMALTMLVAIALSRRVCGGRCSPVRFMLWLALWTLISSMFATFGFLIVGSMIMPSGSDISEAILMFTLAGLVFGLCLYVLNLPFMILGFANPFFATRFCACLSMAPAGATAMSSETDNIGEQ